jgi:hypothetical protein
VARPLKIGLEYFPLDCRLDDKFRALEAAHGNDGAMWIIRFWQSAYQTETGEVDLSGAWGVFRAENSRITTGKQAEIISVCEEIGLLFQVRPGIYTSSGIKKRIEFINFEREKERKRKENWFSAGKLPENSRKTGEREKEKEKEKKDSSRPAAHPDKKSRERNQFFDFVAENWGINPDAAAPRIQKLASTFKILVEAEGFTVQEIRRRQLEFESKWPRMASTPEAVSKHWSDLKSKPSAAPLPVFKETIAKGNPDPEARSRGIAAALSAIGERAQA